MVDTITLRGKLGDILGKTVEKSVTVTVKAPAPRPDGIQVTTTQPQRVRIQEDGSFSITVVPGVGWLYIEGDAWTDSVRFVAAEGMTTIWQAIINALPVTVGMRDYLQAITDARDAVREARETALSMIGDSVADAVSGEIGGLAGKIEGATPYWVDGDEPAWVHATMDGTRLPLGYAKDGTLDLHARKMFADQTVGVAYGEDDVFASVITDRDSNLLLGFRRDGGIVAPGLRALPPRDVVKNERGEWVPLFSDASVITIWGSSTPQRLAPFLAEEFYDLGVTVENQAKGGEWLEHTVARLGSTPATAGEFTIPADGPVSFDFTFYPPDDVDYAMLPYMATINGVEGLVDPSEGTPIFTRSTPGSPVSVEDGTEILPVVGPQLRDKVTIFSMGKNNVRTDPDSAEKIIAETEKAIDYLTPKYPRFLILGLHANSTWSTDTSYMERLRKVNDHFRTVYGPLFIDVQAMYADPKQWESVGLEPTARDREQYEAGLKPDSLSRDSSHFNNAGHTMLARHIHHRLTRVLRWY